MLARAATAGGQIYCSARAAYLWHRQMLWTKGHQLARVGREWESFSLWVAVLPHQGQPLETQASLKPAGVNAGELVGPGACCRKPGPSPGECYRTIRISTASLGG